MACNCDKKKPEGAPDDSIRNAAAMWMSAGKTAGFVEGVQWSVKAIAAASPALEAIASAREWPGKKRKRLADALVSLQAQMTSALGAQEKRTVELNRMAVAMADRLESAAAIPSPTITDRIRAALTALRG